MNKKPDRFFDSGYFITVINDEKDGTKLKEKYFLRILTTYPKISNKSQLIVRFHQKSLFFLNIFVRLFSPVFHKLFKDLQGL